MIGDLTDMDLETINHRDFLKEMKLSKKYIEANKGDPEKQHSEEDSVYIAVVKYYAARGSNIAKEALTLQDMDYPRWYA